MPALALLLGSNFYKQGEKEEVLRVLSSVVPGSLLMNHLKNQWSWT